MICAECSMFAVVTGLTNQKACYLAIVKCSLMLLVYEVGLLPYAHKTWICGFALKKRKVL